MDELRKCLVATWADFHFNRAWRTMQLISGEKGWKHVSVEKVVTLNTCRDVACLTFQLPTHNRFLSETPMFEERNMTFSRMTNLAFHFQIKSYQIKLFFIHFYFYFIFRR